MENRFTSFWRTGLLVLCVTALAVSGLTLAGCRPPTGGPASSVDDSDRDSDSNSDGSGGPTASIYSIAWGGGKFVAGGYASKMAYSSDGVTWTAVVDSTFGTGPSASINSIAWGGGKFVAVGGHYGGRSKIAYSSDGESWTAVGNENFGVNGIGCIAWDNSKFVAANQNGRMTYSSPNGESWTTVSISPSAIWGTTCGITWGNNKFVVVGRAILYSLDGESWTAVADSTFVDTDRVSIFSIAWGNGKFVAGGQSGQMAYSSDGVTWTAVANSTFSSLN